MTAATASRSAVRRHVPEQGDLSPAFINSVKTRARTHAGIVKVLEHFGSTVSPDGKTAKCVVHDDHTPSVSLSGRNADRGCWHCLSCDAGGDAISLTAGMLGLDARSREGFAETIRNLGQILGIGESGEGGTAQEIGQWRATNKPMAVSRIKEVPMTWEQQAHANGLLVDVIKTVSPLAEDAARGWLTMERRIPPSAQSIGKAWLLDRIELIDVRDHLLRLPQAEQDILVASGILRIKDNGQSTAFVWKDCLLLADVGLHGKSVLNVRARLIGDDVTKGSRYIVPGSDGLVRSDGSLLISRPTPYGLPNVISAAKNQRKLVICEGAIKTMGAMRFGLSAIAVGTRPGFADAAKEDPATNAQMRMLGAIAEHLRQIPEVLIVPDHDEDLAKRATGMRYARQLAMWLSGAHRINARACAMTELFPQPGVLGAQPDGQFIKDFDAIR